MKISVLHGGLFSLLEDKIHIFAPTVNCPIRKLDLYHVTSQFIIDDIIIANYAVFTRISRRSGEYELARIPRAKTKTRLSTMAEQKIVSPGEFSLCHY